MRRLIEIIRNIYRIEELRRRIITTLFFLLLYRLGSHIILPGLDPVNLQKEIEQSQQGLLGLINMFSGGAFFRASIFALGIMPYITASIIMQLLGTILPSIQRLQREGESGRRKITQWTRYLTLIILFVQAPAYLGSIVPMNNPEVLKISPSYFLFLSTIILAAGSMFVMWMGERITDKGIGNGISLIIMVGIIARFPVGLVAEFDSSFNGAGGLVKFMLEIVFLFAVTMICVLLVQGTRKIPVQYAKRIVGNRQYGGVRQYIPLKVNAAGVMPIIFAQAIMMLPLYIVQFAIPEGGGFIASLMDVQGFTYNFMSLLLVVIFTYFYTAMTVNPVQMAEDIKRNGGYIPGVKPGKPTADFLDTIMSRITFPGSLFLGLVTILPAFAMRAGINQEFAYFYGGTTLLITVGVVLDTLQQIESHLLMRHYDGLMKTGRITGRGVPGANVS